METHGEIGEEPLNNHAKNINEFKKILTRSYLNKILFSIKIAIYHKNAFSKILNLFHEN